MLNIYRTDQRILSELEKPTDGCWIKLTMPTMDECADISEEYNIDIADVRAALDI